MAIASSGAALAHLTPRPVQGLFGDNYLSFTGTGGTFAAQFLPEVYEKEVERYGNRTISGFLGMVGAEMPMASDEVVWSEQGRIHVAYDDAIIVAHNTTPNTLTMPSDHLLKIGDTIVVSKGQVSLKCFVSNVVTTAVTVGCYTAADLQAINTSAGSNVTAVKVFVYGTEYKKGSENLSGSIDAKFTQFSNKPIILRDRYSINGSDTAQIGWVEVTTEDGGDGFLWYLKSEHEARIRFEDQLEMAMIEAEKKATGSGISASGTGAGITGSEGLFAAISSRGLVYNDQVFETDAPTASPATGIAEFDNILKELDKQGSIEENMIFCGRTLSLGLDNMLSDQNRAFAAGSSYGVFNNEEDMALNLGFSGFRRGSYDFYKSDWKYLNDGTTRGLVADIEGVLVPAGTSTVYDQSLGKNISRPFLHVRYRASEADDRKNKSWITGSVGGNYTSDSDTMTVNFLSERCLCVQAANNFVLFKNPTA